MAIYEKYRHHTERHRLLLEHKQAEIDELEAALDGGARFSEQSIQTLLISRSGDTGLPVAGARHGGRESGTQQDVVRISRPQPAA